MGRAKQEWEEYMERGWSAPDKFVCADCVEDHVLKGIISDNLAKRKCDYCGKGSRGYIAAPVEVIMEPIGSALFYYFNDPINGGVPYDKGLVFEATHTTEDALYSIGLECQDDLFQEVANSFENQAWIETAGGFWASSHTNEIMSDAWAYFVRMVKHKARYFFSSIEPTGNEPDEFSPTVLLKSIGSMISSLELVQSLTVDTVLYRVRERATNAVWKLNEEQLGAPPKEIVQSQRMNPAGISYLYLARDSATAIAEVVKRPPCRIIIASFKVCRQLSIIDLSKLPEIPSIFESERHHERELIYFLINFVNEISKPVNKDEAEHIDYVPSQVVCEYFAKVFRTYDGEAIGGLAYPSTIRPTGVNIVLFPSQRVGNGFGEIVSFVDDPKMREFNNWTELLNAIQ